MPNYTQLHTQTGNTTRERTRRRVLDENLQGKKKKPVAVFCQAYLFLELVDYYNNRCFVITGELPTKTVKRSWLRNWFYFLKKERIKSGRNFEMAMFVCVALECGWNVGETGSKRGRLV